MNITEAAEFLGVSERTMRNYASAGRIAYTYIKGKTRSIADYAIEDLETLKAELENPAIAGKSVTVKNLETEKNPATVQKSARTENNETLQTLAKSNSAISEFEVGQGRIDGAQILTEAFKAASESWPTNLAAKMLLTIPEAMTLSGVKEKPIREAIKTGALKSIRIGRSIQVRPADLQAWIDSQFS